jgi:hypothetical protein
MCEHSLIAYAARDTISIELLEQRDHNPTRSFEFLAQLTHGRRSIL